MLSLVFLLIPFLCFTQTSTEYFSDRFLTKKATEEKAKFIVIKTTNADSTTSREVIRKADQTMIRKEIYKGKEPIGKWITTLNNTLMELDYHFSLVYGDMAGCLSSENTFIPSEKTGPADLLKNVDSIGYIAPRSETTPQDIALAMIYPEKAMDEGLKGEVIIGFRISETGQVTNIQIIQGVHPLLDKEAMRCYRLWKFNTSAFVKGVPRAICVKQKLRFLLE